MNKKISTPEFYAASHGEIVDGVCTLCGASDLAASFCLGVTAKDVLPAEEAEVVREVGVLCEECGYYFHCDDLSENEFYTVCGNCDDRPYSKNMEPLTRDWIWAAANNMLEVQG